MSEQTIGTNNGVQLFVNTDTSKIFIWENRYNSGVYTNSLYDPLVLKAGTLLGRIGYNQKLFLCDSQAIDGSQYPIGILAQDITIHEGETVDLQYCIYGDVVEDKVIFAGDDTFDSVVSGQSLRDRIGMAGIRLVPSIEMTAFDNQ